GTIGIVLDHDARGVRVSVTDTGPGIAENELPRIFDRFYQVESSERRPHGGAGIGLALAKKLTELHGGALGVESALGQGSTFWVELPFGRAHFKDEALERRRVRRDNHPRRRADDRAAPTYEPEAPYEPAPAQFNPAVVRMDRGRK